MIMQFLGSPSLTISFLQLVNDCLVTGWGKDAFSATFFSSQLKKVLITQTSASKCQPRFRLKILTSIQLQNFDRDLDCSFWTVVKGCISHFGSIDILRVISGKPTPQTALLLSLLPALTLLTPFSLLSQLKHRLHSGICAYIYCDMFRALMWHSNTTLRA